MTQTWPADELSHFGGAEQIDISTRRHGGSLRPFVPIWCVVVEDALYVRSYRGGDGAWYRHATAHPGGAIRVDGLQRDVSFSRTDPATSEAIDAAYRAKYRRYADSYLLTMLGETAVAATMQLRPRLTL